eukprot:COSAG06_NODE_15802_length_1043_cov_1.223517_2_plen_176_part_01
MATNISDPAEVRKRSLPSLLDSRMLKNDDFTKTGSGQTYRKSSQKERCVFSQKEILKPDPSISLNVRYTTSMYYVLNSLSRSHTKSEKAFGIASDFIRDIILGLVASVMTTVSFFLSCLVLSCVVSCLVLSCLVLSCVLSCLVLSCVLSCLSSVMTTVSGGDTHKQVRLRVFVRAT